MKRCMFSLVVVLFVGLTGACVSHPSPEPEPERETSVARVERNGETWTVDYTLSRAATAWFFPHSALARVTEQPWRPDSWTVLTPGVRIERHGHYDVLTTIDGGPAPHRIRVRFEPYARDLMAAYDPALRFTDGTVALFTQQFDLRPLSGGAAQANNLPMDLNGVSLEAGPAQVIFTDAAGPVMMNGERLDQAGAPQTPTYVLFGGTAVEETAHMAAVIDPALPGWIQSELSDFTPLVMALYAEILGPRKTAREGEKPAFLVSWAGPTPRLRSMGGSVLPGLVIMTFEGEGVTEPTPEVRNGARWFIAHEAAHFWLGQTIRYERAADAWITEGGADILAMRALARLYPAYDARAELQSSVDDCAALAVQAVRSAGERNQHRAHYACGAVFHLLGEASAGEDVFRFVRDLMGAAGEDAVLTADEWLGHLALVTGEPSLVPDVERLLDQGVADPSALIASLFRRAGVAHEVRGERVVLL